MICSLPNLQEEDDAVSQKCGLRQYDEPVDRLESSFMKLVTEYYLSAKSQRGTAGKRTHVK